MIAVSSAVLLVRLLLTGPYLLACLDGLAFISSTKKPKPHLPSLNEPSVKRLQQSGVSS